MADQILSRPGCAKIHFSTPDLQQVVRELDSAIEQVEMLMDGKKVSTGSASTGSSFSPDPNLKGVVVGLDEDLMQLKDRLTGSQSKLQIVPIIGMGGIGKTTLARNLYNDPLIVSDFPTRAWVTVSQDYNIRAILLGLLGCIVGKLSDKLVEQNEHDLKHCLYQKLCDRKYLIVLDDMWSNRFWDDMRRFFPNSSNGSRIVLTTRESEVANYVDSQSLQHQVQLLKERESWNLLQQEVFGDEDCPIVLQEIGRKIANECGGLPLAIHVIGGLLSKVEKSRHIWMKISNDVSVAIGLDKQFSNILSLSYNHLPNHLKPCFLYMGAFPEDHEIKASKLIHLWVSEGFLKSNGKKSLEEEAEDYLSALVERNLFLVIKNKYSGKPKSVGMHDLLRDLCMKKAYEEKFLHVKNWRVQEETLHSLRRVSAHTSYRMRDMHASVEFMSLARSFLCTGRMSHQIMSPFVFAIKLLRVLDVFDMHFPMFPTEIFQLVHLHYLAVSYDSNLPSEILRLRNLQTLIVRLAGHYVPSEIWEISELRHFKLKNRDFDIEDHYKKEFVQKKLQTISTANLQDLITSGFFESTPNIKNVGVFCVALTFDEVDLRHLHKLETLKCSSDLWRQGSNFLEVIRFPSALRKLNLRGCDISPRLLTTLCALPNLEMLKIRKCKFIAPDIEAEDEDDEYDREDEDDECDREDEDEDKESETEEEEWEAGDEDEFRSLQFLLLESLNLVRWIADETNFPKLRHLVIRDCSALEVIPSGIGEIATLQLIELENSSPSAVASAKEIQVVQQSEYENYGLQLRLS